MASFQSILNLISMASERYMAFNGSKIYKIAKATELNIEVK